MSSPIDTRTALLPSVTGEPRTRPVGPCPLCGAARARVLFRSGDRLHGTPGDFTYRRCPSCRTVFQDPRVVAGDLALCYPREYYTHAHCEPVPAGDPAAAAGARRLGGLRDTLRHAIAAAVRGAPAPGRAGRLGRLLAHSRHARERAFFGLRDAWIPSGPGRRRALDVGCGTGELMATLQRAGWEVEGVEWDPMAAALARQVSGCPVYDGDFRTVKLPAAVYDLVVLNHVLEHLDDTKAALCRVRELLAPGGRATIYYPSPEALGIRLFGTDWFPWEVPRHLVLPSRRALRDAAAAAGFAPAPVGTQNLGAPIYFALSRAYRAGAAIDQTAPPVNAWDRRVAALQRALIGLGFGIGEEVAAVLRRPKG